MSRHLRQQLRHLDTGIRQQNASSSCSVWPCRAARYFVICCWRMLTSVSRWRISSMSGSSGRLAEGRQKKLMNGEMQEDRLSVFLPLTCHYSPPVWQGGRIMQQGEFSLSPRIVVTVLLLAEVLSVVSRCGWSRAVLVAVLTHCCLERNREKVRLIVS